MTIAVRDLLNDYPYNESSIIAGEKGLYNKITCFGILEAPDSINYIKPGEFILSTGYLFKDSSKTNYTLIKKLIEKGCSGLGIKFHRYIDYLDKKIINYCNDNRIPIFSLPLDVSWYDATLPIVNKNINNSSMISNTVIGKLISESDKIISSTESESLLKIVHDIFNNCCSYIDIGNDSICTYPKNFKFPLQINKERIYNMISLDKIKEYQVDNEYNAIVIPINSDTFLIIWNSTKNITTEETLALKYISKLISINSKIKSNLSNTDLINNYNKFVSQLITTNKHNENNSNIYNINMNIKYTIAVSEPFKKDMLKSLKQLMYDIKNTKNIVGCIIDNKRIAFLIPYETGINNLKKYIKSKAKSIYKIITENTFNIDIKFGVSNNFENISSLKSSYNQALETLELGKILYNNKQLIFFSDLGVFQLLYSLDYNIIEQYSNNYLEPIIEYDRINNSDLVYTLKKFIELGLNKKRCAEELFLHPNTVSYRLEKIKEILNLDITNKENIISIEMAIKCHDYLYYFSQKTL